MDPKLKELIGRTNLGELIQAPSPEVDLNQPVETAPPPKSEPMRSTVDPFQINFAATDMVGKLQESSGKGARIFAMIFLGGPLTISGIGMIVMAWTSPEASSRPMGVLFATVLGLAFAGFCPYVIFANRSRKSRSD